ncbi:hypothetical protein P2318_17105 [Myxococcaceae bacterium GXIMD 01537]
MNGGMSLMGVMKLLGHRDYRMTLRYTEITLETVGSEYHAALAKLESRYRLALTKTAPTKLDPDQHSLGPEAGGSLTGTAPWRHERAQGLRQNDRGGEPNQRPQPPLVAIRLVAIRLVYITHLIRPFVQRERRSAAGHFRPDSGPFPV